MDAWGDALECVWYMFAGKLTSPEKLNKQFVICLQETVKLQAFVTGVARMSAEIPKEMRGICVCSGFCDAFA